MIANLLVGLLLVSLLYCASTNILFFAKEHIKNEETKMFSILLVANLIGIILELICIFTIKFYGSNHLLTVIINRVFLLYHLFFSIEYFLYVIFIIFGSKINDNKEKIIKKFSKVYYVIASILILLLDIGISDSNTGYYSYGSAVNVVYVTVTAILFLLIFTTLINFDVIKQNKKRSITMFLYIFVTLIVSFIQRTNPALALSTEMETFLVFLMFHTIENPDLKIIEQLNIARDQADKANQAKSDFLSSMSHEIRTPLNAIVGFSQALQEEDLPPQAQDEVKDIVMASNGLLEIVNGILDISKIESGKIEIVNSEYSFKEIFDNLVALTKARMGDKPLDFRTHYDESIPYILYGDHTRVKQVALNILTNAVKYTKEGYIDFRVSSIVKDDICRIIISVEDTGIGIKEKNIDKLFSKFERFDLEKNITIEGTGLGLAITKKLVDLMGGKIVVQSTYGKGSKFIIAIDQRIIHKEVVVKEAPEEVVAMPKQINVAGKRVLIVDDNKINLKVASRLLETYNLQIETFESGTFCIDAINSGKVYDLILMDDMMPGLSGIETLHKLKEISNFSMPVVALTANAVSGMKEKYLSEGFDDYLSKPIDKEELKQIIVKYLNK